MEINFKELKRKDLQRLCKKHGLRANATNSQMVDSLVYLFKICEKNKQGKVSSKGFGGNGSSKVERVAGDAEKVVIVIDDDEDELGSVVRSADKKSYPKSRRSSEKDEQIEARLDGSSEGGGSKGTRVKWHVENTIILLDEENDEPSPVLRSADRKKSRRSSRKVGKVCESNRSSGENQPVGILRNPKEGLLVPVRTTRSRSMNSEVAHSPVIEKIKARKDRQVGRQNAELPLDTSEFEGIEVGARKEIPSVMIAAGEVKVKRRRNSKNSSMKVNDAIMVSLPIEVSVTENLVGDVVNEKHVNTGMGSAVTFSIDGKQARQGTATLNKKDIEESEICTSGNLMEVVAGGVETKKGKKRTRAGLEEDSPVMEKKFDKLGSAHHPELSHRREIVEPEVCFASSQILGSKPSSNLASSRPCLLLSELQGCQDGGQFPVTNEPSRKQSVSLDRNGDLEMGESLVCKNSIFAGIALVEVDDTFGRRLSTCELDHVSKDGEASTKSPAAALSYSQGHLDIKKCFGSVSANYVRNLEDNCNKCFKAYHNRCAETPVSMNNLSMSSEQSSETLEFSGEVTGVEDKQECQDFEEARGGEEGEKKNKLFEDHEVHKEKKNGSERLERYNDRITGNWDFENTSPVILRVESIIEDIGNIASPASETDEMNDSAPLSVNIDRHGDYNLLYLAESNPETVGREESEVVVEKQVRALKTLVDGCGLTWEKKASIEFEYLAKPLKSPGLDISGNKFQEQSANQGQAAITPTRKIETYSSDRHNKLELKEFVIFRNSEVTRNTSAENINDSCHSQLSSSYKTEIFEVEQQFKASLSSGKEIIDPQNLVSHITDVYTIVSDHRVCPEFDGKDAESTKRRDHRENFSVSPDDLKMLGACKAHLDAVEMGDTKFLETNQSHGEPIEAEDGTAKENGSNLFPSGSDEKTNVANFKGYRENITAKFKSFQKFPDSQRLAETNSGHFFAPFQSVDLQEELYQIKNREPFKLEGFVHIIQGELKHDGEKLCGSEEPQAVGYDEHSEAKTFTGSPPAKVEEAAPFGLNKRVDNLFEKLLCLKKVLRGEIFPVITDSSLPFEEEISCKVLHATSEKEMTSGESFSSHDQECQILNALLPTDPVLEDCEQDSSNSEVNALNKIDEVAIISSPDALQESPELCKYMKSCEGNNTIAASPYECDFYIRPTEREPCQDGGVNDKEFLEIVQGVTARSGKVLEDIKFVSPGKLISFDLEGERSSSATFISNCKLNNNVTYSPAKDINHFGTKRLSESLDAHSSLTSKQEYGKHTVDILKMESRDEVAITISSEWLQGNLELWKCMESCESNNNNATSYESDCTHNGPAEVEPCQVGDINDMDFLEATQGATAKPREILEKIKLASPRKQSRINLESERNSSASCGSQKYNLNNSITNSPAEDIKHFENHCFSETLGGQSSIPIKEAHAKHTVDVLKMESHEEIAITSSGDALHGMIELLKCIESSAAKNLDAAFPYDCDFSYNEHSVREPQRVDDIDLREFLKIDQGATTKPVEVLENIKFFSLNKQSSNDLEVERNSSTSCISKKGKLSNTITNSPAKDIKHFEAQCLSNTSDGHISLPIKQAYAKHSVDILEIESQDGSIPEADTLVDSIPSKVKASFGSNAIDPVEEITRKLINFCVSSSRKAIKSTAAGISSVGLIKDKENNTGSTKMKYSSKRKIRKSTSAGSIRRPLQSVTNQMIE